MCILKIERSPIDDTICLVNANPHDWVNYDIEELYDLMNDCGFKDFVISCYNGFDNCIHFPNPF